MKITDIREGQIYESINNLVCFPIEMRLKKILMVENNYIVYKLIHNGVVSTTEFKYFEKWNRLLKRNE